VLSSTLDTARILHDTRLVKVILICVAILAAVAITLAARALRRGVGMPALDQPKNVTPPVAREMSKSRDERA
jgi:hypothetical protein